MLCACCTRQSPFYPRQRLCRVQHTAKPHGKQMSAKATFAVCLLSGDKEFAVCTSDPRQNKLRVLAKHVRRVCQHTAKNFGKHKKKSVPRRRAPPCRAGPRRPKPSPLPCVPVAAGQPRPPPAPDPAPVWARTALPPPARAGRRHGRRRRRRRWRAGPRWPAAWRGAARADCRPRVHAGGAPAVVAGAELVQPAAC